MSFQERHSQNYQLAQAKGFTERVDELTVKLLYTEEQLRKAERERDNLKGQVKVTSFSVLTIPKFCLSFRCTRFTVKVLI